MSISTIEKNKVDFREIVNGEPEWLYDLRKAGWRLYENQPLPDRVKHLWRYTNPANFIPDNIDELLGDHRSLNNANDSESPDDNGYSGYGYNRNDLKTFAFLNKELIGSGIVFKDLVTAVTENEGLTGKYLGRLVGDNFGKFEAMNLALWNTGLLLYIPDNIKLEKPIRLQRNSSDSATFHRLLIIVGRNVQGTIIDDYAGKCKTENNVINGVAEIYVDDNSSIDYINIQRCNAYCKTYLTQRTQLGNNARFYSYFAGMGSAVSKINAGSVLNGRGAESRISGIAFGDKDQHFDYHTVHHHMSPESFSDINFKIVLKDSARSAYTGLIRIEQDAPGCEAFQENRNLLLNEGTKAESIPELEILCDQVQCSHGATVGQIDNDMIFYLQSRGLTKGEAIKTIIMGFVDPTLKDMNDDLKETIRGLFMSKLGA
jgi:Fe-S cluster assembly protein SufD